MSCPTCGTPIGSGVLVCPNCGTQTAPSTGTVQRGTPTEVSGGFEHGGAALVQAKATSGLAIASLLLGIGSWTVLPLVGSIAAIITGHLARTEIRNSGGRLEGDGLALGGLVTGYSSALVGCVAIPCLIFAVFGGMAAAMAAMGMEPPATMP